MAAAVNRTIRLKKRPVSLPGPETFELVEAARPEPGDGEFLARNIWMSVDPYMRARMRRGKSYVAPYTVGEVLQGGCVAEVIESNHPEFATGTFVLADHGWQDYWVSNGEGVHPVDASAGPIRAYLGVLGMPGMAVYVGLQRIAEVKAEDQVFVTAAAGAVGSVACQIARAQGCRVAGSAGSDDKVLWLREEAGVDAAFNYKTAGKFGKALAAAMPHGIDVFFDNVGGKQLEAGLLHMNPFGRIVACGMIGDYNDSRPSPGPRTLINVIIQRLRLEGFIVHDHADLEEDFRTDMARWIDTGQVKWKETVVQGLENAPQAILGLFSGENMGKMLVQIAPDPTEKNEAGTSRVEV